MSTAARFALLAALTLTAAGAAHAQPKVNYVTVGGQLIALPVPDGFLDPRSVRPATARTIDAVTPVDNRNLSYLVPPEDLARLESQARVNAENEAVQFGLTAKALQDGYNALPEGTSPQDAATQLQPQIQAVQSSWTTLNSKLGCPEMTPAPA